MKPKRKKKPKPFAPGTRLPPIPRSRNHGDKKKYDRKRIRKVKQEEE